MSATFPALHLLLLKPPQASQQHRAYEGYAKYQMANYSVAMTPYTCHKRRFSEGFPLTLVSISFHAFHWHAQTMYRRLRCGMDVIECKQALLEDIIISIRRHKGSIIIIYCYFTLKFTHRETFYVSKITSSQMHQSFHSCYLSFRGYIFSTGAAGGSLKRAAI